MHYLSRLLLRSLALWLGLCAPWVLAQEYPSRPIKMIIPFSAGSVTDQISRMVGQALTERNQQPTVIESRTGAGGIVAMKALQQSPADGYTVGLVSASATVQPWLMKDIPFDVRNDFIPLTMMYAGNYVLVVSPNFPAKTFAEFLAYVRANPGKVSFGSSGTGTTTQLAGEWLKQALNVDMVHVPFRGSPEVYSAIFSGSVHAYFDIYGTAKPLIDAGRVRALAVTGKKRIAGLPNVPAIAETIPDFEVLGWIGMMLPLGTPQAPAQRLESDLRAVLNSPRIVARLAELGVEPGGNSPEEFRNFVANELRKWGTVIKAAGIKQQ